jgi:hypothetical protein
MRGVEPLGVLPDEGVSSSGKTSQAKFGNVLKYFPKFGNTLKYFSNDQKPFPKFDKPFSYSSAQLDIL